MLVVGRSRLVGLPLSYALTQKGAVVTTVHTQGPDAEVGDYSLEDLIWQSGDSKLQPDMIISAAGNPELIRGAWVRPHYLEKERRLNFKLKYRHSLSYCSPPSTSSAS